MPGKGERRRPDESAATRDDREAIIPPTSDSVCSICDTPLTRDGLFCQRCYDALIAQLHRRRDAALRLEAYDDGVRDPVTERGA